MVPTRLRLTRVVALVERRRKADRPPSSPCQLFEGDEFRERL